MGCRLVYAVDDRFADIANFELWLELGTVQRTITEALPGVAVTLRGAVARTLAKFDAALAPVGTNNSIESDVIAHTALAVDAPADSV
jgi:hypothetical protein